MNNDFQFPICDNCGIRRAIYREKSIQYNISSEVFLCGECKNAFGSDKKSFSVTASIFSSFGEAPASELNASKRQEITKCPKCGCTSGEYLDAGYVGCSYCYTVFSPMISVAVTRLQRGVKHVGKRPVRYGSGGGDR